MAEIPKVLRSRRLLQWAAFLVVLLIGGQFTLWVLPYLEGRPPSVPRPPGVEAFLPINSFLALRHLINTGRVDPVHPAGLAIFLGILVMSFALPRSFCSHLCPVGLLSELLGRTGARLFGGNLRLPKAADLPLRGIKFLLLGFFAWAIWFQMSSSDVAAFLDSPYARVVDVKMWLFFARPSNLTLLVLAFLVLASLVIRDFWCRYLCPYGALLGILGVFSPWKITRSEEKCTQCLGCTRACPARLKVHEMTRVTSPDCTACQDCVAACPVPGCLSLALPGGKAPILRPALGVLLALALYAGVTGLVGWMGGWKTCVTPAEYQRRIPEIQSPLYTHPMGLNPAEGGSEKKGRE